MKDRHGKPVVVGDVIKVLVLPNVQLDESERNDVNSMLGAKFKIEQIENDTVEIEKWFGKKNEQYCHSLFLWSNEFELIKQHNDS